MNHYLIFALGNLVGVMAALFMLGLCKAAGEADEWTERNGEWDVKAGHKEVK